MVIVYVVHAHTIDEDTQTVGVFSNRESAKKVADRIFKQNRRYQELLRHPHRGLPDAPKVLCSTTTVTAYKLRD